MWEGGPLRQIYVGPPISRKQRAPGNFMLNAQGLYVAAYLCAGLDHYLRLADIALGRKKKRNELP
jgi:hypothetical protein